MRVLLVAFALLATGCIGTPDAAEEAVDAASAQGADAAWPEPQIFDWSGHVVASLAEGPTHQRPTEDVLWPVFQEGILFHVEEIPQAMEVSLDWTGGGEFMIMLHSHKGDGGPNAYVEHITELDDVNPKCLRVPTEDLTEGHWQVMVHSSGAQNVDFNLHVGLLGGAGDIDLSDRHGHWLQEIAEGGEIDEHEIEECQFMPLEAGHEH